MDSGSPTRNKLTNGASMRSSSQGKLQGHKKLPPLEDAPSTQLTNLNTTKSLQHKRDLIDALRRTNPASVNTAPNIFWDVEGSLKTTTIDDSDVKQQMTIVENGVNYSVKRYNDLKVINERLVKVLKTRLDELEQQKKSWENLDAMKNATTEEGMRIENLNKETEAIQRSISEKTHYSRKLDHMLNRLKNNQLKFDAHMVGMEDTMRSIQKDCADVVLMRRGLDAGLAKAVIVYEETKLQLSTTRKDREVLLEQRKVEYKNAKALQHWLKERERMKIELGIELRGDLTLEEEKFLKSQIDEKMERTKSLQKASEEGLRKLQAMEEAFTKLKQVTGVKNVEEMHEKFSTQKSNKLQLELEVKDAEHRLASAKKAFQKLETTFQELKSSGSGVAELNRDNINRLEELYSEARNDQKSIRADSDRISTVLLGLHQGAQGLLQRVQPYQYLTEGGVFELTQLGEETSPWTETVDALTTAEHILSKMMEAIAGDNATPSPGGYDEEDDNDSIYSRETTSLETAEEAPDAAYNIRIKSHRYLRETEPDEEYLHVFDTRVDDGEHNVPSEAKETGGEVMEDSAVPSRISVKKGSSRVTGDAKRKEEMAARRKRLQDRMENKGKDANLADDPNIGLTAKLKEQKKYAEKLCTTKSVPTLPEGVTLRDDPMTKTNAFLKLLPQLK